MQYKKRMWFSFYSWKNICLMDMQVCPPELIYLLAIVAHSLTSLLWKFRREFEVAFSGLYSFKKLSLL